MPLNLLPTHCSRFQAVSGTFMLATHLEGFPPRQRILNPPLKCHYQLKITITIFWGLVFLQWGSRGAPPPPSDQIFLNFMQFSGSFNRIVSGAPLNEGLRPLLGKSWFRHCEILVFWMADLGWGGGWRGLWRGKWASQPLLCQVR